MKCDAQNNFDPIPSMSLSCVYCISWSHGQKAYQQAALLDIQSLAIRVFRRVKCPNYAETAIGCFKQKLSDL